MRGSTAAEIGSACGLLAAGLLTASTLAFAGRFEQMWLTAALAAFVLVAVLGTTRERRRLGLLVALLVTVGVELAVFRATGRSIAFDANELAALFALFVPAMLGLSVRARHDPLKLAAAAVVVATLGTGSVGGGVALAVGLGIGVALPVLVDRGLTLRRASWIAIGAVTVAGGAAWLALTSRPALLDGRPTIWRQAERLLADVPLLGAGAGAYRRLVPDALPYPAWATLRPVDDAHRLALDVALAGGLPALVLGAVAVGILVTALLRRATGRSAADPEARREAAGWLGALGGHAAWSSWDSVPPGAPGFVALCAVVGLAIGSVANSRTSTLRPTRVAALVGLGALGLALLAATPAADDERRRRALLLDRSESSIADLDPTDDCGLLFQHARRSRSQTLARRSIDCSPRDLGRLAALFPQDRALARHAVDRHPLAADAWRWLARVDRGILAPRWRVAALDPRDATSRLALAEALVAERPRAALELYAAACRLGDPGANACGRGGALAERFGELERARALYRRSSWPPIRRRAEALDDPKR